MTLDGVILPLSPARKDQLTIDLAASPSELDLRLQASGDGIGGAAFFADGLLVAVVESAPGAFAGRRLTAAPVAVFAGGRDFVAVFNDHGAQVEVLQLPSNQPGGVDDAQAESEAPPEQSTSTEPAARSASDRLIDQVEWVSDAPATRDLLSREHLARALTDRLRRLQREDPGRSFLIHVDGPWGSGKTTLLGLVASGLEPDFLAVRFDAWRQSLVGPPWWALLMALRRSVARQGSRTQRSLLRLREARERLHRGGMPYLVSILVLLAVVAVLILLFRPSFTSKATGDLARTISAVLAVIATLWVGTRLLGKLVFWDSAAGARLFEQSQENPMESLADHFAWLIAEANGPVIFLIDDLDRCGEAYVVDLLDAVQTLIRDVPNRRTADPRPFAPHFLVAADGAWIRRSYEERHAAFKSAVGSPGRPLGYLFLDKIFQLTIEVPAISPRAQDGYLQSLLRGSSPQPEDVAEEAAVTVSAIDSSGTEAEVLDALRNASPEVRVRVAGTAIDRLTAPEIEQQTEHALQKFAPLLEPNPRAIKRFVNAYGMARASNVLAGAVVPREQLALWTILRLRWPEFADYLRSHPDAIGAVSAPGAPPAGVKEDLQPLFTDPDLAQVVAFPLGGPLTPDAIRVCLGLEAVATPAQA